MQVLHRKYNPDLFRKWLQLPEQNSGKLFWKYVKYYNSNSSIY